MPTINSVSVGSTGLALIAGSTADSVDTLLHAESWGGSTALVGAQTVSIAFTVHGGGTYIMESGAISATGVDTTTPVNHGNAVSGGSGGTVSLSITSAAGDLSATSFMGFNGTGTPTTNQTGLWTDSVFNPTGGDRGPGTANPTHTWTTGGLNWDKSVMTGANFQAAASGDVTPPTTPGVPSVSNVTSASADLAWAASTDNVGVTAYDLQRALGTNAFVQIATPTTTSFTDTGLSASTQYTWQVRARDAAGNTSAFATSASTTTTNSTTRTLHWTPTAPFTQDGFNIYRCVTTTPTCTPTTVVYATVGGASVSYIDTLSGNPTSCYQVQASLAGTNGSGLSNIACATGGPISLTITNAGTGTGTTIPTGTTTYVNGTVVNLTATPTPTSDFAGWTGAADCTDGSVTITSSTICTATFNTQLGDFAYLGNRGATATKSLSNVITATPTATANKNNLLIVRAVTDNLSTTSGQTSDHVKMVDSLGNQYVKLGEQTRSGGAAGNGVTVSLWGSRPFASLTSANTVTLTLSAPTIASSITLEEYALNASTTFTNSSTIGTNGASASPSAVMTGLSNVVRLFLGALGVEGPSSTTFTQAPNYASGTTSNGTNGGASTANVASFYGSRRFTGTGDSYAPALAIGTTPNWALLLSSLATAPSVNIHPLTLNKTGAGTGTVTGAGTYYQGSVVQIQAIPDPASAFAGWTTTSGSNCTDPTNPTVNVTLNLDTVCLASFSTPNVAQPNRVLTINTAGTGGGTTTGAGTYPDGSVVTMTAAPNAASFFGGWSPAACSTGTVTLTADTTCTATFTLLPTVTMTATATGSGLGTVTGSGSFIQGANAIITATPNVGSVFSGWSGSAGCSGTTSPLTVLMDSAKSCVATFTLAGSGGPTGFIVTQSNKRCPVSLVLGVTSGALPITAVTWYVDGVQTISTTPGGKPTQTTAPFVFTKTLVRDGASVTANVTDSAGASAIFGPNVVACP
jgi:hypothetical protein